MLTGQAADHHTKALQCQEEHRDQESHRQSRQYRRKNARSCRFCMTKCVAASALIAKALQSTKDGTCIGVLWQVPECHGTQRLFLKDASVNSLKAC